MTLDTQQPVAFVLCYQQSNEWRYVCFLVNNFNHSITKALFSLPRTLYVYVMMIKIKTDYILFAGHSRTIVGIEELADKTLRLLIFDPSTSRKQMQQFLTVINATVMRTIRRTEYGLRAKQYQIVAVDGFVEDKDYDVSCKTGNIADYRN